MNKEEINRLIDENIIDNDSNLITAQSVRNTFKAVVNNIAERIDENLVFNSGSYIYSEPYEEIEYNKLIDRINGGKLIPGRSYRIIDYRTTTTQPNTQYRGHRFDVIVTAISKNCLSYTARAINNENNYEYFKNSDLSAWEIKYDVNNDKNRFSWADDRDGSGVIYYMKDEYGNECPYDFKNITFKINSYEYYTFDIDKTYDATVLQASERNCQCRNNVIKDFSVTIDDEMNTVRALPFNVFSNMGGFCINSNNIIGTGSYYNFFGANCSGNILGYCYNNMFGSMCVENILENNCNLNEFYGNNSFNKIGNNSSFNEIRKNSYSNTIESNCSHIIIENNSNENKIDNGCSEICLPEDCCNNTFNTGCKNISLTSRSSRVTAMAGVKNIGFDKGHNKDITIFSGNYDVHNTGDISFVSLNNFNYLPPSAYYPQRIYILSDHTIKVDSFN